MNMQMTPYPSNTNTVATTTPMQMNGNNMSMYMVGKATIYKGSQPLSHVILTIGQQQVITNAQGVAEVEDLMTGPQTIYTSYNGENLQQTIDVTGQSIVIHYEDGKPVQQQILVQHSTSSQQTAFITVSLYTLLVIFFLVMLLRIKQTKRRHRRHAASV